MIRQGLFPTKLCVATTNLEILYTLRAVTWTLSSVG